MSRRRSVRSARWCDDGLEALRGRQRGGPGWQQHRAKDVRQSVIGGGCGRSTYRSYHDGRANPRRTKAFLDIGSRDQSIDVTGRAAERSWHSLSRTARGQRCDVLCRLCLPCALSSGVEGARPTLCCAVLCCAVLCQAWTRCMSSVKAALQAARARQSSGQYTCRTARTQRCGGHLAVSALQQPSALSTCSAKSMWRCAKHPTLRPELVNSLLLLTFHLAS